MTGPSPEEIVRDYFVKMAAADAGGAFGLLAPDVCYRVMGTTPISVEAHGVAELLEKIIRPFIGRLQGNRLELVPDEFLPSGDRVVVLAHSVATGASGKPYENQYAMIFTVREGRISELREYLDTALLETAVFGRVLSES